MNYLKGIFTAFFSFLSAALGILYIPVLLMVGCNVIDYITGLMAAGQRHGGISSYKSIKGITKKIAMWLLVVVGAIIDNLLIYCTKTIGIEIHIYFFVAAVVAVWIICNEIISILENLLDIGVSIPKFLMPLVKQLKSQVESKIETDTKEDEDEKINNN